MTEYGLLSNISSCFPDTGRKAYSGHHLDLSGSRDVVGHLTIRFPIGAIFYLLPQTVFRYKTHHLATIHTLHRRRTDRCQTDTTLCISATVSMVS